MDLPLLRGLHHDGPEAFNYQYYAQITVGVISFTAVSKYKFKRPLLNVQNVISKLVESQVSEFLFENVDAFFHEFRFHVMETISQHYDRNIFVNVCPKRLNSLLRECIFPVTASLHI